MGFPELLSSVLKDIQFPPETLQDMQRNKSMFSTPWGEAVNRDLDKDSFWTS